MQSSMDRKAKCLRELRDDGAISDEDYRRMVLDLVDAEGGHSVASPKPAAVKEPAPSSDKPSEKEEPPKTSSEVNVPEHSESTRGDVLSESLAPIGSTESESKPDASSLFGVQDAETGHEYTSQTRRLTRFAKRRKAIIAVAAAALVVFVAVVYGFWTGDIAFKSNDISQEYWDAGREARAIGKDYLNGKVTAKEAKEELGEISVSDEPWNATGNPALPLKEVLNDQFIYRTINGLKGAIDCSAHAESLGQSVSNDRVRDAMNGLEQALRL